MADEKAIIAPTTSPLNTLVQDSRTPYSAPQAAYPTMNTTQAVATMVASASATPETIAQPTTTTTAPTTRPVSTAPLGTGTPILNREPQTMPSTRPLLVTPVIPIIPTGSVPLSTLGGGGGGGGGMSSEKEAVAGVKKKSWLPIILIGVGVIVIASKFLKKKTA